MSGCCDIINTVMKMGEKRPERKPTRIKDYDYSSAGAYFVTICTQDGKNILSEIICTNNTSVSRTNEMIPHIISTFKRFCNKEIGYNIFQRSFLRCFPFKPRIFINF